MGDGSPDPAPGGSRPKRPHPTPSAGTSVPPHPTLSPKGRRSAGTAPPGLVLLGEFGRPHGLKGEVRLKSYTADPKAVASYGELTGADGRPILIEAVRRTPGEGSELLIARVAGIATREAAEALNRLPVYVAREKLGQPGEDEFFLADLVGLDVRDETGASVGRVIAVPDYGGGELIEIAPARGGPTTLVPFTKAFVPVVDLAGGFVTLAAITESEARGDGEATP